MKLKPFRQRGSSNSFKSGFFTIQKYNTSVSRTFCQFFRLTLTVSEAILENFKKFISQERHIKIFMRSAYFLQFNSSNDNHVHNQNIISTKIVFTRFREKSRKFCKNHILIINLNSNMPFLGNEFSKIFENILTKTLFTKIFHFHDQKQN